MPLNPLASPTTIVDDLMPTSRSPVRPAFVPHQLIVETIDCLMGYYGCDPEDA
jgi:hypothetical protein